MKKIIFLIGFVLFISTGLLFSQETKKTYKYPYAVVPYIVNPPVINGKIQKGQLKNFLAITGMVTFGNWVGSLRSIVPNIQQVVWYLGYNNKYLYIMMKSPNPPGHWLYVNPDITTNGRSNLILFEDHVEIQIAKNRENATYPGIGFYKINVNPKGYYSKQWFFNGTPGTESVWPFAGKIKCFVDKKAWYMEIAVNIRSFNEKNLTGKKWVLQLLRADAPGGLDFAGWTGSSWMEWNKFGEVKFDKNAPVFRFLNMGDLVHGNMDLGFEVTGQTEKKIPVVIEVNVYNANNKNIFSKTKKCIAVKSQFEKINFKSVLALSKKGKNRLEINAYYLENGKEKPLYIFQAPVIDYTKAFWAEHITPWLKTKPKGDYSWNFAYWPSYNVAENNLNFNVFGLPKEIENAKTFKVIVKGEKDGKTYGKLKGNISNKKGYGIIKGLNLPTGNYAAKLTLYNGKGEPVSVREIKFVKKSYPWEHNKIGISDKVWPPYTPIQVVNNKTFKVWGREYILRNNGLLSKIYSGGGTGIENILSGKMSFKGEVNNQPVSVTNASIGIMSPISLRQIKPGKVKLESIGMFGSLKYTVNSHISYDGWYKVNLNLTPTNKTTYINSFYLSIPLWNKVDTIYVQRDGDGRLGNEFGNLPKGQGLIWSSLELLPYTDSFGNNWGSFAPIVFLGNGDKGLWWFASQDRDWKQSKKQGCIEVYKNKNGTVDLRINIISEKDKIAKPINIHFAFLVDPVKPVPNRRKWEWGVLKYGHNTDGYRLYGDSVDGFETTHKDRVALRKEFLDPNWKPELKNKKGEGYSYFRDQAYNDVGVHHEMYVLYGSGELTGLGLPGFKTYGGEWLGQTNWKPDPQTEFTGRTNMEGTMRWETPRQLTTVQVNWIHSFQEAYVWYYYKLLKDVPFNGTWWDNSSINVIKDYDPKLQEFYYKFNVFQRRRLTKRFFNICHELGKNPWWLENEGCDMSFCQVDWHIENDFYTSNPKTTMMQQLPVGQFRAECRIKRGMISRLATRLDNSLPQTKEDIRKVGRSIVGMCLLNDIGTYWWGDDRYFKDMVQLVNKEVGFFDGAQFLPYWRNQKYLKIETPKVYASIYRGKGKAVIVVVNENPKSTDVKFSISNNILHGKKITRIYDMETHQSFEQNWNGKESLWGEFGKPGVFVISGYGVRFIAVE